MKNNKQLWHYFKQISSIPRASGHENKIANFLVDTFKQLNAEVIKDKFNNVVARIPATKGYQKLPMITLQAHSDMVTVKKDGYKHDFNKDSLSLIFNENYVIARNTSLGADNGIGIALILALFADTSKPHGPLEAIITTKEEIGLLGAKALNPKYVQGEYLINLDSENDKEIIIGCVGSSTIDSYTNLKLIKTKYSNQFLLSINNLLSGHSGLDIAKGHMNAIKGIFYVMQQIQKKYQCCISDITGGSVLNAIPSSAYVAFNTNAQLSDLQKIIQKCHEKLIQTYPTEGKFQLSLSPTKLVKESINEQQTNLIIVFFNRVFNGVKTFNKKYQLPQASSNLGKVFIRNKQLYIGFNGRDLHVKSKLETNRWIMDELDLLHAHCKWHGGPGWNPELKVSNFAKQFKMFVKKYFKKDLSYSFSVGGIEPKDLLKRITSFKAGIAYGVDISSSHSINEKLSIPSAHFAYDILSNLYLLLDKFH